MSRPLLYVCAPWRRRTPASIARTKTLCRKAADLGWLPLFGPWVFAWLDDAKPKDRAMGLELDMNMIEECVALMVVGETVTEGMAIELKAWTNKGGLVFQDDVGPPL